MWILATVLFLAGTTAKAQHTQGPEHETHETHGHHTKHHIALFNGITSNLDHETSDYTFGVDYEYRINPLIATTVLAEYIAAESEEVIVGAGVAFHPYRGLKLVAAPMLIFAEEHAAEHLSTQEGSDQKKEGTFAFRAGAAYEFHFGRFSVGPVVNYDMGQTNAFSYGIAAGIGF